MEVHVIQPELNPAIFGARTRPHLLHQAVVMQLANRRAGSAATKSKGFVSGGGKKPWRQKGTGRARAGSIRSPIWVGGGTTFGPQPRDYSYRMPRTARRAALLSALSMKNRDGRIIVVDKFELEEPKTKRMVQALKELQVDSALIVISRPDETIERSARNLPKVKVLRVHGLNVYDLVRYDHLIMTQEALRQVEERFAHEEPA
jgi:large subunit ribosomal protein L4